MNAIMYDLCFPAPTTAAGDPRRVGVELKFSYLEPGMVAGLLIDEFGGSIHRETDHETRVRVPELGDFLIQIDMAVLTGLDQLSGGLAREFVVDVVPCELVTPLLAVETLPLLDRLVTRLREASVEGTDDDLGYAFGVQFNPEAPALDAESILGYLRAFVLLYDWLRSELGVDANRQLSTFIQPYPPSYARKILADAYRPDLDTLMDDYLAANPTRDRALDLLPLFGYLDEARVRAVLDPEQTLSPRPAYHYRLPNSYVAHPEWRVTDEWCYWLALEWLVADPARLQTMARAYRRRTFTSAGRRRRDWATEVPNYLPAGPWCDL